MGLITKLFRRRTEGVSVISAHGPSPEDEKYYREREAKLAEELKALTIQELHTVALRGNHRRRESEREGVSGTVKPEYTPCPVCNYECATINSGLIRILGGKAVRGKKSVLVRKHLFQCTKCFHQFAKDVEVKH